MTFHTLGTNTAAVYIAIESFRNVFRSLVLLMQIESIIW